MKEGNPCEGRGRVVEKERGETICYTQQQRDTGKECPVLFIRISILGDAGKVEGIPSEQSGWERWESRRCEDGTRGSVKEGEVIG